MTYIRTCQKCEQSVSTADKFCDNCGELLPEVENKTSYSSSAHPEIEVFNFRPWFPAGSIIGFGLRVSAPPQNTKSIKLTLGGRLSEEGDKELSLRAKQNRCFEDQFECIGPKEGGNIRMRINAECILSNGQSTHFETTVFIPLIANHWHKDLIKKNLKGLVVELKNKGGLLRQEGEALGKNIDRIIIDNEDGITRLMGDIENGGILSWKESFTAIEAPTTSLPAQTTNACLNHIKSSSVKQTRIFAKDNVTLGRPMVNADLWLTVHPLNDPSNHVLMDRISRHHATIRWHGGFFEIQDSSTSGTWLNQQPMRKAVWYTLQDNDLIEFLSPAALTLRVHKQNNHSVYLRHEDNGNELEEYLLLAPNTKPSDTTNNANPMLFHHDNGFVFIPPSSKTQINKQSCSSTGPVGLHCDDSVRCEQIAFDFVAEAYPGGTL